MLNRRSFFGKTATAAAAVVGAPHIAKSDKILLTTPGQRPNRIIHIVSDGMSLGTLRCADIFSTLTRKRGLSWVELMKNPSARIALMNTRSLNSLVTDSSAASSAWGSGSRVTNGAVNTLPDGTLLTPLFRLFAEAGWKTGLVTTAEITHATPAGFAVAVKSRGDSEAIAVKYFDQKVDVLLGGGRPFFSPNRRKDKRDLRGEFQKAGYTWVADKAELDKAPIDKPILGTFADSHLPYTIDHKSDAKLRETMPTLTDLTKAALARLERSDRFILQVEGARIDHAAHNSDAATAMQDQIALDEAIDVCLEFQRKHPDTLLVITTDHANSNLGLNGMGGGYGSSSQRFATLAQVRVSLPEIIKRLESAGEKITVPALEEDGEDRLDVRDPMAKIDPKGKVEGEKEPEKTDKPVGTKDDKPQKDDKDAKKAEKEDEKKFTAAVKTTGAFRIDPCTVVAIIAETTGYKMSLRRAALVAKTFAGESPQLYDQMNPVITQLGQALGNRFGVGWTGNTHTADYVQLTAIGPGSEKFTGLIENTDVFFHYTSLAGINFKNPTRPLIARAGPEADEAECPASYASIA